MARRRDDAEPLNEAATAAVQGDGQDDRRGEEKRGEEKPSGGVVRRDPPSVYLDPDLAKLRDAEAERNNRVQVEPRGDAELDPKLAELRDAEAERNSKVEVQPRQEPTIDPELERIRDEEAKRGDRKVS